MSPFEKDVLTDNRALYDAFNQRNVPAMEALWADRDDIACIHPGWGALRGREYVLGSWTAILSSMESPQITGTDETIHVMGTTAFVLCHEAVDDEPPQLIATNIFLQVGGAWLLVHHHASPIIQVLEEDLHEDSEHPDDELPPDDIMH